MDYEHYILQGEAKSTEFSDDRSYLLVQKANSYCACVGQTEECCLPKIVLTYDFGPLLYTCLDRCDVWLNTITNLFVMYLLAVQDSSIGDLDSQ